MVVGIQESEEENKVKVELWHELRALSDAQADNLMSAFLSAISSIPEANTVDDVELVDDRMQRQILRWNQATPGQVDACIHHLIDQRTSEDPDALAIDGHDGSFTYRRLDQVSSKLASRLVALGVGPEVAVAIYFEKSVWAIVSILAILKAGGMFVPIDPAFPIDRVQYIIENVKVQVLLTSETTGAPQAQGFQHHLAVSQRLIDSLPACNIPSSSPALPHNAAYTLYTSGSTGLPKGVVVEHGMLCSSAMAHGHVMGIGPQSRVLQFAAYTFDVSIGEILTTLSRGGCICVMSEQDRLGNLSGAIEELRANWIFMTPTALQTISPEDCPSVETVCVGGEAMMQAAKDTWGPRVKLLNGYGPTECTIFSVATDSSDPLIPSSVIGRAMGCRGWIVRPGNAQQLMPVGAVGELLLEGPIVARGYFGDPVRTNKVFLDHAPSWMGATPHRMYLTGDLVRYNVDGSISYIGRNDGQVKIRGQRTELSEIEHNLIGVESDIAHCVVLLPKRGTYAAKLMAVVSFNTKYPPGDETTSDIRLLNLDHISSLLESLAEKMAQRVPGYMIPQVWLPVVAIPWTTAGKIDRRLVTHWVEHLDQPVLDKVLQLSSTNTVQNAEGPIESAIAAAWAQVLGADSRHMSTDRTFFNLGGDSMLAMLVINECRRQGIEITARNLLRGLTITELAQIAALDDVRCSAEGSLSRFEPSPGHNLALGVGIVQTTSAPGHWRTVQLQLLRPVSPKALETAMQKLAGCHFSLRTTFINDDGKWSQGIGIEPSEAILLAVHEGGDISHNARSLLDKSRAKLDLSSGPVTAVDYFPGTNQLALTMSQLTLDLESWHTLLRELDVHLDDSPDTLPPSSSLPLSVWAQLSTNRVGSRFAMNPEIAQVTWKESANLEYWGLEPADMYLPHDMKHELRISPQETEILSKICSSSSLKPVDLLMAAASQSFSGIFTDRGAPNMFLVHNVREQLRKTMDVEQDITGYFDTIYPVQIAPGSYMSPPDLVTRIRGCRAACVERGVSFMMQSYTPRVPVERLPEITVNYLASHVFNFKGTVLEQLGDSHSNAKATPPLLIPACISVTSTVVDGILEVAVAHCRKLRHQDVVRKWVQKFETALRDTIDTVVRTAASLVPADFPLVHLDGEAWLWLRDTVKAEVGSFSPQTIEDILPCSPVQEGILLSQARGTASYEVDAVWKLQTIDSASPICASTLEKAWGAVVSQHPAMRTIFVDGTAATEAFLSVVLRCPAVPVIRRTVVSCDARELISTSQPLDISKHALLHRLTIAQTPEPNVALVHLKISHAVVDGVSFEVLRQDLAWAYGKELMAPGQAPTQNTAFRDYVSFTRGQDNQASVDFWRDRLSTITPCHFPLLQVPDTEVHVEKRVYKASISDISALNRLCQTYNLTISNLVQVTWGLILQAYTSNAKVCFGYLTAGREAPVSGIDNAVGVFINMLVSNLELENKTVRQALEEVRDTFVDGLDHQYVSLSKIQSALQLGSAPLFNTVVSCFRDRETDPGMSTVKVDNLYIDDTSEFSIALKAGYTRSEIAVSLTYWTSALTPAAAEVVGSVFLQTLQSLPSLLDVDVSAVRLFDEESCSLLRLWNGVPPVAHDVCLHDIISQSATLDPGREALCSTAGGLTYGQMDDYSTRLAHHLVTLGVAPESIVPLLFEKSIWAVVVMLGILKAGGAFVGIDPSNPPERLAMIIEETGSSILLTSTKLADRLSKQDAVAKSYTITPELIKFLPAYSHKPCSTITPDNAAYVCFTSGSTGRPKGVVVEHRALSTSTIEHGKRLGNNADSRSLQFASYAWDVSIGEIFATLVHRGCICMPTEEERMEDLAGFMNRLQVNWAFLTPTVARMLKPADVPLLKTLACGGELVGDLTTRIWCDHVTFVHAYGPTEATIFSTASVRPRGLVRGSIIGTMMGSAVWIVSPNNADVLMPVGAIGEMLIEGPILAREYRNNPDKTAEAFIQNPQWSSEYPQYSSPRRLYRTGDLVRYNMDGSLDFIRRNDTQVKIRGQRVEIGEIESTLATAHEALQHVCVAFTKKGGLESRLVAVISLKDSDSSTSPSTKTKRMTLVKGEKREKAKEVLQVISENLTAKLPRHMVPTVWVLVEGASVPLSTAGKMDRRTILSWLENADERVVQDILALDEDETVSDEVVSEVEAKIRSIWALVLNLAPSKIGLNRSFFSLGGDSISAMQVIPHCRAQGIHLSVQDVFRSKTIAALGTIARSSSNVAFQTSQIPQIVRLVEENFPLSPVQHFFYDLYPDGNDYFNQSFLVKIPPTRSVTTDAVQTAMHQIVKRHSMLRARFSRIDGHWTQRITTDVAKSLSYQHSHASADMVDGLLQLDQERLNTQTGPLMSVRLVQLPDCQILLMAAHHLVIDLVSWRVLLDELEAELSGKIHPMAAIAPFPFQSWIDLQIERAAQLSPEDMIPYAVPEARLDYWGFADKPNLWGAAEDLTFTLDRPTTEALLGSCNEAMQTDPLDLFLAAAFQSFHEVFPDRPLPAIFTEGHGREVQPKDQFDLSRTIGWFTSILPVSVDVQLDAVETLKRTKDARRAVPGKGVPYFAYRYLTTDGVERFGHHAEMEILLNYSGQYQQLERGDALLQPVPAGQFEQRDMDPSARRLALFDIAIGVAEGQATVSIIGPRDLMMNQTQYSARLQSWSSRYASALQHLASELPSMANTFTCGDFPLMGLDPDSLQSLEDTVRSRLALWSPDALEAVYPCSPVQQGMLLSQSKDSSLYYVRAILKILSPQDEFFRPDLLEKAWYQLVRHHPILRTVFVDSSRHNGIFDQVVLREGRTISPLHKILDYDGSDPVQLLQSRFSSLPTDQPPVML